jgi:hypothetical protein
MKREVDMDRLSEIENDAVNHIEAICGLLGMLVDKNFLYSFDGALRESGEKDKQKSAFMWLYGHYDQAAVCAMSARLLADDLKTVMNGLSEVIEDLDGQERERTE